MHTTGALRELHRLHVQLSDLRHRLQQGPRQIRAREANVARLKDELQAVQDQAKAARVAADQKQLQLKVGEGKIEDLKGKLNACKTNREYQSLREQIAADEMTNSVLTDEILESLEKVDALQEEITAALATLDKAEVEMAKTREAVPIEQNRIEEDLSRLERELRTAEAALPSDTRVNYDRMIQSKGSDGMAQVDGEICGGCFQSITPNMYNSLMLAHIVFCGTCGRLLYLPEERSPSAKS